MLPDVLQISREVKTVKTIRNGSSWQAADSVSTDFQMPAAFTHGSQQELNYMHTASLLNKNDI